MAWNQIIQTALLFLLLFLIQDIDLIFKGNFQQRVHKEASCKNTVSAWQGIVVRVRVACLVISPSVIQQAPSGPERICLSINLINETYQTKKLENRQMHMAVIHSFGQLLRTCTHLFIQSIINSFIYLCHLFVNDISIFHIYQIFKSASCCAIVRDHVRK